METEDVKRIAELLGSFPGTKQQRLALAASEVRAMAGQVPANEAQLALLMMSEIADWPAAVGSRGCGQSPQ